MFCRRLLIVLFLSFLISIAVSKRDKKMRDKKGDKAEIEALSEELEHLKERLDKMEHGGAGEEEAGSKVHFFFHSGSDEAHAVDADTVHVQVHLPGEGEYDIDHIHEAHCEMHENTHEVHGHVHIVQESGDETAHLHVKLNVGTMVPAGQYEMHVHENGDLSGGCGTLGGHYMPSPEVHGDFSNVTVNVTGMVDQWFNHTSVAIEGKYSIIGRSIKLHKSDGSSLACCVIGWSHQMDHAGHHGSVDHEHHHHSMHEDDEMHEK